MKTLETSYRSNAMLGRGVYSFKEAARLTGLKETRVREWFRRKPMFLADVPPVDRDFAMSFHDLIDVSVAGQLRNHGVSLRMVRRVYRRLQTDFATDHPFCRRELLSDGKMVFLRALREDGNERSGELLTKQRVFEQVLLPFLRAIDYHPVKRLAGRWRIRPEVVVDPAICYGAPIIEAVGMPTSILAAAYEANQEDADLVARWYNVKPEHVLAAADFESSLAA